MEKDRMEYFKNLLFKLRNRQIGIIASLKDNYFTREDRYVSNELSNYDNHPAELGTDMNDKEMANCLMVSRESTLKDIDRALRRIREGTYGKCAICGRDIDEKRLEAVPYAVECIECRQERDEKTVVPGKDRPVEELVLGPPFGKKYLSESEADEDEGMDQLKDVMRYGSADTPQDMGGYTE
jgi:RNA polymerase-binding transcription factor DksA